MFFSRSKNHKKFGILSVLTYIIWVFIIISLIVGSWLFLFVYQHIYYALIQEAAIINLKSQFVITKVNKQEFDNLIKKLETKKSPLTTINFKGLENPFKTIGK